MLLNSLINNYFKEKNKIKYSLNTTATKKENKTDKISLTKNAAHTRQRFAFSFMNIKLCWVG